MCLSFRCLPLLGMPITIAPSDSGCSRHCILPRKDSLGLTGGRCSNFKFSFKELSSMTHAWLTCS